MRLDAHIPSGPLAQKWDKHRFDLKLVSPANKDRAAHRHLFGVKCGSYLQAGVGLVIVDVVTDRAGNLHRGLLDVSPTTPLLNVCATTAKMVSALAPVANS